jgi:cysteinyl-tRNA synthetase
MSKSLGNFFTLRDIYKRHHPEVLRLFLISSHYRSPIDFSEKNLEDAEKVLTRLYESIASAEEVLKKNEGSNDLASLEDKIRNHELTQKFKQAMDDDFNTAVAVALLNEGLRNINRLITESSSNDDSLESIAVELGALKSAGDVLGLFARTPDQFEKEIFALKSEEKGLDTEKVERLIADRTHARTTKNWAMADQCRDELTQMGVVLEDTPDGTLWKIK